MASPSLALFSILSTLLLLSSTRASTIRRQNGADSDDSSSSGGGGGFNIIGQLLPDHLKMNLQELSNLAMNPVELSNQSLLELYRQSADIINGTGGADSVLFELDSTDSNGNGSSSAQPKILVMAVYNPDAPSHDDLLDRFSLYFVNMTDTMPPGMNASTASTLKQSSLHGGDHDHYDDDHSSYDEYETNNRTSSLAILQNFAKNQVNALLGAFWMPFNVGAQTMEALRLEHAQYVAAGSTFGSALSKPVIMQAIALPNSVASRIINVTGEQVSFVETAEAASKQAATGAIDAASGAIGAAATGVNTGIHSGGRLAVQYAARPLGAFIGGNVNLAGAAVSRLGQGLDQAALQLNLLGDRIGESAQSVVSGGSWALAWAMDEEMMLPSEVAAMEAAAAAAAASSH